MDYEQITALVRSTAAPRYVQCKAEVSETTCKACHALDGAIFAEDDPERPQLPLHPNCRCEWVKVNDPAGLL